MLCTMPEAAADLCWHNDSHRNLITCLLEYMHKLVPIADENGRHRCECDLDSMYFEPSRSSGRSKAGIKYSTVNVSASPIESADRSARSGAIDS